jgi:hypothetical protein
VVSTDLAARAVVIGQALIENSTVRITREDISRVLATPLNEATPKAMRFVPEVFTANVGGVLDRLFHAAELTPIPAKAALIRLLAIRVAMLAPDVAGQKGNGAPSDHGRVGEDHTVVLAALRWRLAPRQPRPTLASGSEDK